jgi:hypothetical protein
MRGGKAIRFEVFLDPAEALRAVGLPAEYPRRRRGSGTAARRESA